MNALCGHVFQMAQIVAWFFQNCSGWLVKVERYSMLLILDDDLVQGCFDIVVLGMWRKVALGQQDLLLGFVHNNLHNTNTGISASTVAMESDPKIGDELADEHADCTGHQAANDAKKSRNNKET